MERKLRIAVWHNLPSGGGKRALYDHVKGLVSRGHYVESWCPDTADQVFLPLSSIVKENIISLQFDCVESKQKSYETYKSLSAVEELIKALENHCQKCANEINQGHFDVLYVGACMFLRTSAIAKYVNIPSAIYLGEPYRWYYESLPTLPLVKCNSRSFNDEQVLAGVQKQMISELEYAKTYTRILVNSAYSRESVLRSYNLDSRVCYLGIDTNKYHPTSNRRGKYVLGLGTICHGKGVDRAIRAVSTINPEERPTLIWVGNGANPDDLPLYNKLAQEQRVNFETRVNISDDEVVQLLSEAVALIYTSRLEPFGLAPLEANACGTPVIAIGEGGVRETIKDKINGFLVSNEDAVEIGNKIKIVLDNNDYFNRQSLINYVNDKWSFNQGVDNVEKQLFECIPDLLVNRVDSTSLNDPIQQLRELNEQIQNVMQSLQNYRPAGAVISKPESQSLSVNPYKVSLLRRYWFKIMFLVFSPRKFYKKYTGIIKNEIIKDADIRFNYCIKYWSDYGFIDFLKMIKRKTVQKIKTSTRYVEPSTRPLKVTDSDIKKIENLKKAVVLHIHYDELVDEMIAYLKNIPYEFDLYISTRSEIARKIENIFTEHFPVKKIVIQGVPNRGYDIGPFVCWFNSFALEYDLVLKIHAKRSYGKHYGAHLEEWRKYLLSNLIGSGDIITQILKKFVDDESLGMVFPDFYPGVKNDIVEDFWDNNYDVAKSLAERLAMTINKEEQFPFSAGSMFWFRPKALKNLFDLGLIYDEFLDPASVKNAVSLAHALERLFSAIVRNNKYTVEATNFNCEISGLTLGYVLSLEDQAQLLKGIQLRRNGGNEMKHKTILIFDHDIGGGANEYSNQLVTDIIALGNSVLVVKYNCGLARFIVNYYWEACRVSFEFKHFIEIEDLLRQIKVDDCIVNELVSYLNIYSILKLISSWKSKFGFSLKYLMHDYFCLCPNYTLLDFEKKYCNLPDLNVCENCIRQFDFHEKINLEGCVGLSFWRKAWGKFLYKVVDEIIFFSIASQKIVLRAYPFLRHQKMIIRPHEVENLPKVRINKNNNTLNIGILGAIATYHKGGAIIKRMAELARINPAVKIIVVGEVAQRFQTKNLIVHGRYERGELVSIVEKYQIDVILIPSIWPETFSYTTQEAIMMGLPVGVFNYGALPERIAGYEKGFVVDNIDPAYVLSFLMKRFLPEAETTNIYNINKPHDKSMHYFTSITANYLPKARILATTLKKFNPDAVFSLVISDDLPVGFKLDEEPFDEVLSIYDLGIPVENLQKWIFKHSVVEMCTAVKGQALYKLLTERRAGKVVYLDPDMAVFHKLDELEAILDKSDIVITPHQTEPEETREAVMDNEIVSLQHGIYNFGFCAVKNSSEGIRFAKWWRDRLVEFCYDDIPNGLFTDQRWGDFIPVFFSNVCILRDKTYNVATWNLTHRQISADNTGKLMVEGSPLKIYHFSGFDSGAQEAMLKRYSNSPLLFDLRNWYINEQKKCGQDELGKKPSCFEFYSDGQRITKAQRILYRTRQDVEAAFPIPDVDYLAWYLADQKKSQDNEPEKQQIQVKQEEAKKIVLVELAPVDIVIPVYNGIEFLVPCLESVFAFTDHRHRVIVVDDASPDEQTKQYLRSLAYQQKIVLLENEVNLGFIGSVNRGMKSSSRDIILLNSDTEVTPGWVEKICNCAYSRPNVATVTPLTNNGTICSVPNWFEDNIVPPALGVIGMSNLIERISERIYPEIPVGVGFCLFIFRRALDSVGYFDEKNFGKGYCEENDFCWRARKAGYIHLLDDATFIYHKGSMSFGNNPETQERQKKAHETLVRLHPDYSVVVEKFIADRPIEKIIDNIKQALRN